MEIRRTRVMQFIASPDKLCSGYSSDRDRSQEKKYSSVKASSRTEQSPSMSRDLDLLPEACRRRSTPREGEERCSDSASAK